MIVQSCVLSLLSGEQFVDKEVHHRILSCTSLFPISYLQSTIRSTLANCVQTSTQIADGVDIISSAHSTAWKGCNVDIVTFSNSTWKWWYSICIPSANSQTVWRIPPSFILRQPCSYHNAISPHVRLVLWRSDFVHLNNKYVDVKTINGHNS